MKSIKYNLKLIIQRKETLFSLILIFFIPLIQNILTIYYFFNIDYANSAYSAETLSFIMNFIFNFALIAIVVFPLATIVLIGDISTYERERGIDLLLDKRLGYKNNQIARFLLSIFIPFILIFLSLTINYLIHRFIFYSGSYFHESSLFTFDQNISDLVLKNIWLKASGAYILIYIGLESMIYSLLSCLTYSISLFIKQRILIYIIPLIIITLFSLMLLKLGFEDYALLSLFEPARNIPLVSYFYNAGFILSVSLGMFYVNLNQKDRYL